MEPDHEDSLSTAFNTEIRPFIDVIDTLRSFGIQEDVALPNVVVVGDQSSGKSSIIEALSGVQLPRGKGIVTRCPLELQLKRVLGSRWVANLTYQSNNEERVDHIIYKPSEVEEFIRAAQNDICGPGKGVSKKLITLRIESPAESAPDLTLIDLPGIARIALSDQPTDICEQIRKIIIGYVKPANTVILCVISAFLDIAVNESIKIAQKVDPKGERTIGVITKPDLADESQKPEVLSILDNERIHLMKGFCMVKCRSQKELDDKVPLETSTENERKFFENDDIYRGANTNQLGTMNLASKISEELVEVIKTNLPQLKANIANSLYDSQKKLDNLPERVPDTIFGKKTYLSKFLWSLDSEVKELLNNGVLKSRENNMFQ